MRVRGYGCANFAEAVDIRQALLNVPAACASQGAIDHLRNSVRDTAREFETQRKTVLQTFTRLSALVRSNEKYQYPIDKPRPNPINWAFFERSA